MLRKLAWTSPVHPYWTVQHPGNVLSPVGLDSELWHWFGLNAVNLFHNSVQPVSTRRTLLKATRSAQSAPCSWSFTTNENGSRWSKETKSKRMCRPWPGPLLLNWRVGDERRCLDSFLSLCHCVLIRVCVSFRSSWSASFGGGCWVCVGVSVKRTSCVTSSMGDELCGNRLTESSQWLNTELETHSGAGT